MMIPFQLDNHPNQIRCAKYGCPGKVVLESITYPECTPGSVLVRVDSSGICGSDLLSFQGIREQPAYPPGHEFSGIVVACGAGVTDFFPGDRVCVEGFSHCGKCEFCQAGRFNLCVNRVFIPKNGPSGFSEVAVVSHSSLHHLPDCISYETGALVEPLAVGLHALNQGCDRLSENLLIIGAGTIGLCTLLCAAAKGITNIFMVAKHPHQAQAALLFGAKQVFPLITGNDLGAELAQISPDVIINTSTSENALIQSIRACKYGGTIVLEGGYSMGTNVALRQVVSKEIKLVGSICYGLHNGISDFDQIIGWISTGTIRPNLLITHRFPLHQIAEAFDVAQDKTNQSIKVMIKMLE
jgi:2-desacetyl-2-hydroxyethyl bacteriochlorophyllide A dehydrogenase